MQYESDLDQNVGDFSGGSSDEYVPSPEREVGSIIVPLFTQKRKPRGIKARQAHVQQGDWIVDDVPTVALRGRGTNILRGIGRRSSHRGRGTGRGTGRGRGRGRGRGLHMERLDEHTQIVDSLIEDDVLFPTTEPRVKVARKTAPILTKGMIFYFDIIISAT